LGGIIGLSALIISTFGLLISMEIILMGNYRQQFYQFLLGIDTNKVLINEDALEEIKKRHGIMANYNKKLADNNKKCFRYLTFIILFIFGIVFFHKCFISYLWIFSWLLISSCLLFIAYMIHTIFVTASQSMDYESLGIIHEKVGDSIIKKLEENQNQREEKNDGNE